MSLKSVPYAADVGFPYEQVDESELSISKGERVTVIEHGDEGWVLVQNLTGGKGWVPIDYLDEVQEAPAPASAVAPVSLASALMTNEEDKANDDQLNEALKGLLTADRVCCVGDHPVPLGDKCYTDAKGQKFCDEHVALMTKQCSTCGKDVFLQCVTVLDDHYHPQCWHCSEAGCSIVLDINSDKCDPQDSKYYCATHYAPREQARRDRAIAAARARMKNPEESKRAAAGFEKLQAMKAAAAKRKNQKKVPEKPQLKERYTHEELKAMTEFPDGFDKGKKEKYLSDEDFLSIFKMSREELDKMAAWKAKKVKQGVGLF